MRANIPGFARPVRIDDRSSRATPRPFHLLLGIEERFLNHPRHSSSSLRSASSSAGIRHSSSSLRSASSSAGIRAGRVVQVLTSVPIFSPVTARAIFPSVSRLKTSIGIPLSIHRLNAVASATFSPRSMTSRWVISVSSSASGLVRGSSV